MYPLYTISFYFLFSISSGNFQVRMVNGSNVKIPIFSSNTHINYKIFYELKTHGYIQKDKGGIYGCRNQDITIKIIKTKSNRNL